ncbi:MAG: methyltransferase [Moorea sp. SIO2B7]|nr:methyltransferase [Moorena sp. SIO2B7]
MDTEQYKSFKIKNTTIKIKIFPNMAEPSEGYTQFLLNQLNSTGKTALDLGCGTGILAIALAKQDFETVYAVDIHEDYIAATQYNAELNDVSEQVIALKSNLFEAIPTDTRFDLMVANLPATPAWDNIPLYSRAGEDGRDLIDAMLHQAPHWLIPEGRIQFTQSSRISPETTMALMSQIGYAYDEPMSQVINCKQHRYFELYPQYFQQLLNANRIYVENGVIFEWVYLFQAIAEKELVRTKKSKHYR